MTTLRFDRRMSDQDALMWSIEKDPLLRSTITSVMLLDGAIDRERFAETIERASREVPRLRQKVVTTPLATAPPEFVVDPNFDFDYHLRFQKAPGSGSVRDLLDYAGPFAMAGFDRDRPLWEYVLIEDMTDGKSALVSKVHHALTDGVGGMEMLLAILDTSPEGEDRGPMPPAPEAEQPPLGDLVTDGLAHEGRRNLDIASRVPGRMARALLDPIGTARQTAGLAAPAGRMMRPVSEPMSPIMNERSLSIHFDTITASLPDLKAAAKAAGGKLNDAFVAAVAGGLRHYHDEHGVTVEELRMTMPVNIRPDTDEVVAGNQFVPARFVFPVGIADPAERIRALHDLVTNQREEPAMRIVDPISGVLNRPCRRRRDPGAEHGRVRRRVRRPRRGTPRRRRSRSRIGRLRRARPPAHRRPDPARHRPAVGRLGRRHHHSRHRRSIHPLTSGRRADRTVVAICCRNRMGCA